MLSLSLSAQKDSLPPFKRNPVVPAFTLLQPDSSLLTRENITKNEASVIMYFSPLCEHCQHQMEDMLKRMEDLRQVQIIMATYQPMNELTDFIAKYELSKYPNIKLGRDTKYMLQPFYKIGGLPYLALYDKNGSLITHFEGNVSVDKLLAAFKEK
jgi:thioredoxin-related protein